MRKPPSNLFQTPQGASRDLGKLWVAPRWGCQESAERTLRNPLNPHGTRGLLYRRIAGQHCNQHVFFTVRELWHWGKVEKLSECQTRTPRWVRMEWNIGNFLYSIQNLGAGSCRSSIFYLYSIYILFYILF